MPPIVISIVRPGRRVVSIALGGAMLVLAAASPAAGDLPWAVWEDLHRLPVIDNADQVLLRSSHCPSGCRYDRHSEGAWRYIRRDGSEGIIFEQPGPGAVTRIWMTTGDGISAPLDPGIVLRIYLDGSTSPAVAMPLPALFDSTTPPFLDPLVGDRSTSSGGFFSYVPITYRDGCRITLEGADQSTLWFQITFHRLDTPDDVVTWNGSEDLADLELLLSLVGGDPWVALAMDDGSEETSGTVVLSPGEEVLLALLTGPDSVTGLWLELPPERWQDVELRMAFDGDERVSMRLTDFFAVGRGGPVPTSSLLVGQNGSQTLYSYFPMPFQVSCRITLRLVGGATTQAVDYRLRQAVREPLTGVGAFGAEVATAPQTTPGEDFTFAALDGAGKWVGLFADLQSVGTSTQSYLEGDERVTVDGSTHPVIHGTGVEDAFNGGFYFDQGAFSRSLHGCPYDDLQVGSESATAAYRLMLTDAITFGRSLRARLEGGPGPPTGHVPIRLRTTAYFYTTPERRLRPIDRIDVGDPDSRAAHGYRGDGVSFSSLSSAFLDEPPTVLTASGAYRGGEATFTMAMDPTATHVRLRRLYDAALAGQDAEVLVDGVSAGRFPAIEPNPFRRWAEVEIPLSHDVVAGAGELVELTIVAPPGPGPSFSAFVYELIADGERLLHDGFESGDTARWSAVLP